MCIKDLGCLGVKTAANAIYNFKPSAASSSEIDSDWFCLCISFIIFYLLAQL